MVRVCLLLLFFGLFPCMTEAAPSTMTGLQLQVAFIRDGNLWIKNGQVEQQLTTERGIHSPRWSHDSRWISYQKRTDNKGDSTEDEVWVYNRESKQHERVIGRGSNVSWSPTENILAFQSDSILNTSDFRSGKSQSFQNVALGVDSYSWLPNGTGFLVSASAHLMPDGWTNPVLYKIALGSTLEKPLIERFFTVPHQLSKNGTSIISIGTSTFSWSADRRWIAFIVHPTASWSADSNMLCLLSDDGKTFKPVGEMLHFTEWVRWAPAGAQLGYIAGGGRETTSNKRLTILDIETGKSHSLTPDGFVDLAFTWQSADVITVSRARENKQSKPLLMQIDLSGYEKQKPLTKPPTGMGDYDPIFVKTANHLSWVRLGDTTSTVWLANSDGTAAAEYIKGVGSTENYYGARDWSKVLQWYGTSIIHK